MSTPSPSSFREAVYKACRQIPRGKVVTYGQLARIAGRKNAARAVGTCMAKNPDAPNTPCHRVVGSNGSLHGYSAGDGLPTKKKMLLEEGVIFNGSRVDLLSSQWDR